MISSVATAPAPSPQAGGGCVLIVDDNDDLVASLSDVLALESLEVRTASSPEAALDVAKREPIDVAIVDVKLPGMSGVDLIDRLRDLVPMIEVVLITGAATVRTALGALRSGAFAFVLKSFRPEELSATVREALAKVQLKRDREALEKRFRDLAELTNVLVVGFNRDGLVDFVNRKVALLVGDPADGERAPGLIEQWIPDVDGVAMRAALDRVRERGDDVELETSFGRDGDERRIRWHLSRAGAGADTARRVYAVGIDVTDKRATERRLAEAEALSAMGALALNLAHEIRNPLNAATLQLHLLGRDVGRLEIADETLSVLERRVGVIESEIGRLNRLLTEFLELARPRALATGPVDVGELVREVIELERERAATRSIELSLVDEADARALGDREKLKQVILNLVVNAIEAISGEGRVEIQVRDNHAAERTGVELVVRDTGPGIEPRWLKSIFEPFFTTKAAGTGLGLAIARKIVEQHGGRISIDAAEGGGARVRIELLESREKGGGRG